MFGKIKTQARLPEDLVTPTISGLAINQVVYIVPWGMVVDSARDCWLKASSPYYQRPSGTSEMRIELRIDGFHVRIPRGTTWSPTGSPIDASSADYIPVAKIYR